MSENDVRPAAAPRLPHQRAAQDDLGLWPEPWFFAPRPRNQFWDHETAGWRSAGPVPRPRSGD